MAKRSKEEIAHAREELKGMLARSPERHGKRTVYGIVRNVSRSGMQREISLHVVDSDGEILNISYHASCLVGWSLGKHGGVRVAGCGMDMIFYLVATLMHAIDGDGVGWIKHFRMEQL